MYIVQSGCFNFDEPASELRFMQTHAMYGVSTITVICILDIVNHKYALDFIILQQFENYETYLKLFLYRVLYSGMVEWFTWR